MRSLPRPIRRGAATAVLVGTALVSLQNAAQADPREVSGAGGTNPRVTLEVHPAAGGQGHAWDVRFDGAHLQPADGNPRIEWVVDTYAPATGAMPVTVAEGAVADPVCRPGAERASGDEVSSDSRHLGGRRIPAGTDRVMVYGAYCAPDGQVHRFELESDVSTSRDGSVDVHSYPVVDGPADGPNPRPDGPPVETGWSAPEQGGLSSREAAAATGLALLTAGGVLTARGRRAGA